MHINLGTFFLVRIPKKKKVDKGLNEAIRRAKASRTIEDDESSFGDFIRLGEQLLKECLLCDVSLVSYNVNFLLLCLSPL